MHRGGAWKWFNKRYHAYIRSLEYEPLPLNNDINTGWVYMNENEWDYIFGNSGMSQIYSRAYVEWYGRQHQTRICETWALIDEVKRTKHTKKFLDLLFCNIKKIL